MNAHVKMPTPLALTILEPVARFNLRIDPADLAVASDAFGVPLPARIGQGAAQGDRAVWCLGPDEWLLHAPAAHLDAILDRFEAVRADTPHSLIVLSDREISIAIEGTQAVELLSVGCPLDLRAMVPGMAKRTLFDVAQVVLICDGPERFRMEVWRSFFPHVHELLEIARKELAVGL